MKRLLLVILLVGGLVIAGLLIARGDFELLKRIGLWMIGLSGALYAGFQSLLSAFGSDRKLDEATDKNEQIKADHERMRAEVRQANERLAQERATFHREIERLEAKLASQRADFEQTARERERIATQSPQEYYESLSEEERRKLDAEMMDGVIDGSTL